MPHILVYSKMIWTNLAKMSKSGTLKISFLSMRSNLIGYFSTDLSQWNSSNNFTSFFQVKQCILIFSYFFVIRSHFNSWHILKYDQLNQNVITCPNRNKTDKKFFIYRKVMLKTRVGSFSVHNHCKTKCK